MTDPYLTIASLGGTMQSNEIASTGVGVEVKAGVTGFGLPSVELQFDQATGDGARYRGQRVLQRSVDLGFHVYGPERADLKSTLDRISTILAHPVTVTFHDPDAGEEWSVTGYRSGGGDYSYGNTEDSEQGSDGQSWCNLVVSILTESPFWEAPEPIEASIGATGDLELTNTGSAGSPPTWTVQGPTLGFSATAPSGEVLEIPGFIGAGDTITIDCARGTVRDQDGNNRYSLLAPLPKFWTVPTGESVAAITLDQQSQEYQDAYSLGRANCITNPKFSNGDLGWSNKGFYHDGDRMRQDGDTNLKGKKAKPRLTFSFGGLSIGETYVAIIRGQITPGKYRSGARRVYSSLAIIDGGVAKVKRLPNKMVAGTDYVLEFVADNYEATFRFIPDHAVTKGGKFQRSNGYITHAYVGEPGRYFDGSTADNATFTYSWSGDPGASRSIESPVSIPTTGAEVSVSYKPRKWLVI